MTLADRTSIVVGVDESGTSDKVALWAADLAERMHVPLVLAHAIVVPAYYSVDVLAPTEVPLFSSQSADAMKFLEQLKKLLSENFPDVEVSTWSNYAPADLALLAWSRHAQMIVVGAHHKMSVESLIVGSTTARVVNHAECPVVVWRGEPFDGPVVVGVDGSPLSKIAVEHAFEMASRYRTDLRAVHAWDPGVLIPDELDVGSPAEDAVLAECLAGWSEKYPDVEVTKVVVAAPPEEALQRQALDARLVVVGSHGRGRASSLLLGSTSRYLLSHSPCPVLVCRSEIDGLA
ncbi:MAG: universal stress protein [Nocardiaceae bacterium]|nr:universal stress protein [Nocardiaceae bacterium]